MTSNTLAIHKQTQALQDAKRTYLANKAENTRRAYEDRLSRFMDWRAQQGPGPFVAQLAEYIAEMEASGFGPRSIQAHVATIKGLLRTAAALDESGELARYLPQLALAKAKPVRGEVQGQRLNEADSQKLINAPGVDTNKGRRDTAILALMDVCGMRRGEVCALNWQHIAELDGHKVILNLKSKHGRIRTIKLSPALWRRIVDYAEQAGLDMSPDSPVFVSILKGDRVQHGRRLPSSAIYFLVAGDKKYQGLAERAGLPKIAPHDLRRTAASLARKAGASIEQVQHMLGHASPQTTSAYIGESLDLDDNAVDFSRTVIP